MMKKIAFLLIMIMPVLAWGQELPENIKTTGGNTFKVKSVFPGDDSKAFLLPDGEEVYIVPATYKGYLCYRFDNNMNLIKRITINLMENDLGYQQNIEYINENIYLFLGEYDQTVKVFRLYVKIFDVKSETISDRKELYTIPSDMKSAELIENVIVSEDRGKFAVINKCVSCTDNPILKLSCYDSDLNLLWSQDGLEWDQQDLYMNNFQIDNEGNVYRLHLSNFDGTNKLAFSVYRSDEDGAHSTAIELEDHVFFDISFNVNNKSGAVTMFYGNNQCAARGVAYVEYDKEKDILRSPVLTEFPSELFANEMCTGKSTGLFSYEFRNLLPMPNGNYAFIAEQNYDETIDYIDEDVCRKELGSGSTIKGYNRGSLVIVIFSPEGKVLQFKKIPKIQQSYNSLHLGMASFVSGSSVYVLYNDNPQNDTLSNENKAIYKGDDNCSNILLRISEKGEVSRYVLPADVNCKITPATVRVLNDNEVFYCGRLKSEYRAAKIRLN
ncbi:MAG: hypothetical protein A2W93_00215 [Bacteroidetes bacterium GWF2_43_63]|nr:MAG: hypothetical protein A2W94_13305 [Bacteroidetes bacterium GWE2_42_42]OFY53830.1 MAG: hypothetical protein A2W93_00215 [Bacteroidetes bacterium GWF2_43_63]HBG69786.1 hypothetical protein [Bacteroidales bacterium]HCB61016.1 hypothetical protein [Bacteroidales bacterium]HCY24572.1 hypothetical protein [Bacteroidales bacterium]